jgi:NADH:ubiquinone oxidoreductase subunit H
VYNFVLVISSFILNEQTIWAIHLLSTILFILITVAIYTLAERKLMAVIQRRVGPEVISSFG